MAGYAAQDRFDPRLQDVAVVLVGQLIQDIQHHRAGVHCAKDRRRFAHCDGTATERFDPQPEFLQLIRQFQ